MAPGPVAERPPLPTQVRKVNAMLTQRWRLALIFGGLFLTTATGGLATAQDAPKVIIVLPAQDNPATLPAPKQQPAAAAPSTAKAAPAPVFLPPVAGNPAPSAPPAPGKDAPNSLTSKEQRHYNLQQCFIGFPEEFEALPLGDAMHQNFRVQVSNGDAARMTLYHMDFVDGGAVLNLHGRDRLAQIGAMLPHNCFPIVVERTPWAPALAEARRLAILTELANSSCPTSPERVVIGVPIAVGLSGVEARQVYGNYYIQMQKGGIYTGPSNVGGFGAGATGGGGSQGGSGGGSSSTPIP